MGGKKFSEKLKFIILIFTKKVMKFKEIESSDIREIANMYVDTFNSPPWNDKWTVDIASKRLSQMMNCEGAYGIVAYEDKKICGMILGCEEEFYTGIVFNVKEFCINNKIRGKGFGTRILEEFQERLKSKGISEIILLTLRGNSTEGFYQKKGFVNYDKMIVMGKQL